MLKRTPPAAVILRTPTHLLAFGLGAGLSPLAPGTVGALLGLVLYWPLQGLPLLAYVGVVTAVAGIGMWVCDRSARALGVHDHSGIVLDEIVGYLVTMAGAPSGWFWALLGFILFRLFDVAKPWPVSWVDRRVGGGVGIMLDDVVAGLYGLVAVQATALALGQAMSGRLTLW